MVPQFFNEQCLVVNHLFHSRTNRLTIVQPHLTSFKIWHSSSNYYFIWPLLPWTTFGGIRFTSVINVLFINRQYHMTCSGTVYVSDIFAKTSKVVKERFLLFSIHKFPTFAVHKVQIEEQDYWYKDKTRGQNKTGNRKGRTKNSLTQTRRDQILWKSKHILLRMRRLRSSAATGLLWVYEIEGVYRSLKYSGMLDCIFVGRNIVDIDRIYTLVIAIKFWKKPGYWRQPSISAYRIKQPAPWKSTKWCHVVCEDDLWNLK